MKNFEDYSKANNMMVRYDTNGSSIVHDSITNERLTGYPNPKLYDQFYINKYSFPKGLSAIFKSDEERVTKQAFKQSLYDIKIPNPRRGINGWKLTRRPHEYIMSQGPEHQSPQNYSGRGAGTSKGGRSRTF